MNDAQYEPWEKFLREMKILKLKARRTWHRFDKRVRVTRRFRRLVILLGIKLITMGAPSAQISLHAQTLQKQRSDVHLLAKNEISNPTPEYSEFISRHREEILNRQENFALDLWKVMQKNIKCVQSSKNKAGKTTVLRNLFKKYKDYGISIDPRFYCASAGVGSLIETVEDKQYHEYDFLLECLSNPNACLKIIEDLQANFGETAKTDDIQKTLSDAFEKNPRSVCIVLAQSRRNSRSGKHYLTVFSNVIAVDTLISVEQTPRGKVAGFNNDAIYDIESYFKGSRNKGYVFNITELAESDLIYLLYQNYLREHKLLPPQNKQVLSITDKPLAFSPSPKRSRSPIVWEAVGRKNFNIPSQAVVRRKEDRLI